MAAMAMSGSDVVRAIEHNQTEFLLAMGRAGGGHERNDEWVQWIFGGSPVAYHNAVVGANLDRDNADSLIAESKAVLQAQGIGGSWHVGPWMRPSDLGRRLEAFGFDKSPEPQMAADLGRHAGAGSEEAVVGLFVEAVERNADLADYESVLARSFGDGPAEAAWARSVFETMGVGSSSPWTHLVGRMAEQPVATATVFLTGSVAGIYFVSTLPENRGRGIGTAITRAAMETAAKESAATAILGSSSMGHRLYRQIGFEDVCTVDVYEWTP
jgi:GNAT superfamily N-acetyltransferase